MENAGNEDGVKSEFGTPAEGPPKLSLLNNKTMFVDVIVNNAVSPVNFSVSPFFQFQHTLCKTTNTYDPLYCLKHETKNPQTSSSTFTKDYSKTRRYIYLIAFVCTGSEL